VDALAAEDPALRARFADIALLELAAAVESGSPVQLQNHVSGATAVRVESRTVVLAHPRASQQAAYELAVLERFCAGNRCSRLTAVEETTLPVAPAPVEPHWEFGPGAETCSYRGLQLRFAPGGDLGRRRDLCREFLQEVETLALAIARQARHGVTVEWEALEIRTLQGRPGHLVLLNRAGDSLLANLPLLAATPALPGAVFPWLRGRFAPGGPAALALTAAELGWE